jgi:hypothetical protein
MFSDFKIRVFWDMTPCCCVWSFRRFEGMQFFHLQDQVIPLRWRFYYLPQRRESLTQRHGVASRKTRILRNTVARTSNLEFFYVFYIYLLYGHLQPLIKCRKRSKASFFLLPTAKCNTCAFEHLHFKDRHDLWERHIKLRTLHKRNLMPRCCEMSIKYL